MLTVNDRSCAQQKVIMISVRKQDTPRGRMKSTRDLQRITFIEFSAPSWGCLLCVVQKQRAKRRRKSARPMASDAAPKWVAKSDARVSADGHADAVRRAAGGAGRAGDPKIWRRGSRRPRMPGRPGQARPGQPATRYSRVRYLRLGVPVPVLYQVSSTLPGGERKHVTLPVSQSPPHLVSL